MAPRSRGAVSLFDSILYPSRKHICGSCRKHITQARNASTATAEASQAPPISQLSPDGPGASPFTQPRISVKAGVVVSRAPLVTPDPHPFDTSFHLYQRRLNERLALPFTQYFHYKRGTPAFEHWRTKRRDRGGVAGRDIGKYNAYTEESWNDELLVGDQSVEPSKIIEQLVDEEGRAAEFAGEGDNVSTKLAGLKRSTEADQKNDETSLDRSLARTLYLLVRNKAVSEDQDTAMSWRFPSGDIEGKEGLKEAAERVLGSSCGVNMNTWFVASHPIGHHIDRPETQEVNTESQATNMHADKTFFIKARIFSGQADVKDNSHGVEEFKWLSKQEIEKYVTPTYWQSIKNMLVEP